MSQLHIVDEEAFTKNLVKELQKIERFLTLESYFNDSHFLFNSSKKFYCYNDDQSNECLRGKKGHKNPPLEPELRKILLGFFEPYNEQYIKMIDQRFN